MSARILAFRHVPFEGLGLIEPELASRGIQFDYADLYRFENHRLTDHDLPDTAVYAGLIFLGGPMSANDPLPYLNSEIQILERALAEGTPVLGVCLGAQLISKTLGARVYRNNEPEIGWFDIHFTQAADSDRLFAGLKNAETVFHWHSDTFDLPAGAELLAGSDRTKNQAFRYASSVYALQFHLEVTPQMIIDWCQEDENCGDVRELSAPPDPWTNRNRVEQLAQQVFGRWCDSISPPQR